MLGDLTRAVGETYLVGADGEHNNLGASDDPASTRPAGRRLRQGHRPAGHDLRYAIDSTKLRTELGWPPRYTDFGAGLAATIEWYQAHEGWWRPGKAATEAKYARAGSSRPGQAREAASSTPGRHSSANARLIAIGSPDGRQRVDVALRHPGHRHVGDHRVLGPDVLGLAVAEELLVQLLARRAAR